VPQVVVRRRQALWHSCATVETDCPLGEAAGRSVEAGGADSRITAAQRVINALWGIHLNGVTQASCSPRAVRWRALQARRVSAR